MKHDLTNDDLKKYESNNSKGNIKELMQELRIINDELLKDIEKQLNYTYAHRISYKNYVIAQDENREFNDVIVLKDGKEVFHSSNDKKYSDEELKKYLIGIIKFLGGK